MSILRLSAIGVLRLRRHFALRSPGCAQDDSRGKNLTPASSLSAAATWPPRPSRFRRAAENLP